MSQWLEARGSVLKYFQVHCVNSQKVPFAIVSHQAKTTARDFGKSSQVQPVVRSGHWKLAP